MNFLIYDDNQEDINDTISLIEDLSKKLQINFNLKICPSTSYLFENISKFDFLFLDIEIRDENGIEIGYKLKEISHHCKIIITSNFKKYLIQGYKINAERYFLKPISRLEFLKEMEGLIYIHNKQFNGIYDEKISKEKILFTDILYIDVYQRKTRIHFKNNKSLSTNYSLKELHALLDNEMFSQSHKSFVINLKYVSSIFKDEIQLINSECIPLSRSHKKTFEEKYLQVLPRLFV